MSRPALAQTVLIVDKKDRSPKIKLGDTTTNSKVQSQKNTEVEPNHDSRETRILVKNGIPIPCKKSSIIKKINATQDRVSGCFNISDEGVVTVNRLSPLLIAFEVNGLKKKLVCQSPSGKRQVYIYSVASDKYLKFAGERFNLEVDYDENGKCFDVTNSEQPLKKGKVSTPTILIPNNPAGTAN